MGREINLDESDYDKLMRKMKKNPMMPIGITAATGIVVYGLYNFKNRKTTRSMYLINMRLAAQGTVVGCLALSVLYSLFKENYNKFFGENKKN